MITTTNGAKKFESTDNVTLANLNANADVIDAHISSGGASHAAATTSANGFMSAADKTKLNGIATGANAYTHPTGDGNQHVPATGTTNNGRVLKAGATAGSAGWGTVAFSEITSKPTTLNGYGIGDAVPTRMNAGVFEYYDGTEWLPMGNKTMVASNTTRISNATEVSGSYGASSMSPLLVAKIVPPSTGEMLVTFEAKAAFAGASVWIATHFAGTFGYNASNDVVGLTIDYRTPLGTQLVGQTVNNTGYQNLSGAVLTTSYTAFSKVVSVNVSSPFFLLISHAEAGSSGTGYLRNLAVKFDYA